jgi:hypothetical protein
LKKFLLGSLKSAVEKGKCKKWNVRKLLKIYWVTLTSCTLKELTHMKEVILMTEEDADMLLQHRVCWVM